MNQWPAGQAVEQRQPLRRSREPMIAGVCGGLAQYLGIDPVFVRLMFGLLALFGGTGFLVYFGAWMLMPPADTDAATTSQDRSTLSLVLGGVMLGFAALLALFTIGGFRGIPFGVLILLFTGIALLNRRGPAALRSATASAPPTTAAAATGPVAPLDPAPPPPPAPVPPLDPAPPLDLDPVPSPAGVSDPGEPLVFDSVAPLDPENTTGTDNASATGGTPFDDEDLESDADLEPTTVMAGLSDSQPVPPAGDHRHWAVARTAAETSLSPPPTPSGPPLASITMAAIAAVLGVALVLNTLAGVFVGAVAVSGTGLAIVGVAIAVTAYRGRTLPLLPIAAVLAGMLAVSPVLDDALADGTGSRNIVVGSADELAPSYRLGVGSIVLDLSRVDLTGTTAVEVELGTGAIEIRLPDEMVADVRAETTLGYTYVLGSGRAGINPNLRVLPSVDADRTDPMLLLNVSIDMGSIDVHRS